MVAPSTKSGMLEKEQRGKGVCNRKVESFLHNLNFRCHYSGGAMNLIVGFVNLRFRYTSQGRSISSRKAKHGKAKDRIV